MRYDDGASNIDDLHLYLRETPANKQRHLYKLEVKEE